MEIAHNRGLSKGLKDEISTDVVSPIPAERDAFAQFTASGKILLYLRMLTP